MKRILIPLILLLGGCGKSDALLKWEAAQWGTTWEAKQKEALVKWEAKQKEAHAKWEAANPKVPTTWEAKRKEALIEWEAAEQRKEALRKEALWKAAERRKAVERQQIEALGKILMIIVFVVFGSIVIGGIVMSLCDYFGKLAEEGGKRKRFAEALDRIKQLARDRKDRLDQMRPLLTGMAGNKLAVSECIKIVEANKPQLLTEAENNAILEIRDLFKECIMDRSLIPDAFFKDPPPI